MEMQLNTSFHDAKWIEGKGLSSSLVVSVPDLLVACSRAAAPGLAALRSNVSGIRMKTGRLRASPGVKIKVYGRTGTALVGFKSGVAPHAYFVEFGAKRSRQGSTRALRPLNRAFETARGAMEQAMAAELKALAEKAMGSVR